MQMDCEEINKKMYTHPKYWYQCQEQADAIFTPLLQTYEIEIQKLQKVSKLSAEVTETKSILQSLKYENQNLKDEYDKILSNNTTNCTEKSCHNYISMLQAEIKKYKNQYEDISKLYDNSKTFIEKLTDERDKAENKVKESSEVLKKIKEDLKEIIVQKNQYEIENKKLKEDHEIVMNSTLDLKNENNQLNKDILKLKNKFDQLNEENESLNAEYDVLLKSYEKDSKELINANVQNSGLKCVVDDLKAEITDLQKQQSIQLESMKLLNKKLENCENERQLYQLKHSELLEINSSLTRDNESKTLSEKNMRFKYYELENSSQKQIYSIQTEYENKIKESEKKYRELIEELKENIKKSNSNYYNINNNNNNNNNSDSEGGGGSSSSNNSNSSSNANGINNISNINNNNEVYSNKIKKIIEEWENMKNKYQNEIDILNDKYKSLQTQYQSANEKNIKLTYELDECKNKISLLEHQIESLKEENSGYRNIQKEVIVNSNKINGLLNSNAELETKYKISISEKNMLNNNYNHLQLLKDESERNLNSQIVKLKQMNYDLAQKLNDITNQNNLLTHELAELKKQISIEQIQQDIHSLYNTIETPLPVIEETK